MRDAIDALEHLVAKNIDALSELFLAPAVVALPNRFEHQIRDCERIQSELGVTTSKCASYAAHSRTIFMCAASLGANGEGLARAMVEEGSSAQLASACGKAWTAGEAAATRAIRMTPFGTPKILSDVQWELRVPMTGSERELLASLDVELSEQTPSGKPRQDRFACEFDHAELVHFFTNVEKIQTQLDALI